MDCLRRVPFRDSDVVRSFFRSSEDCWLDNRCTVELVCLLSDIVLLPCLVDLEVVLDLWVGTRAATTDSQPAHSAGASGIEPQPVRTCHSCN